MATALTSVGGVTALLEEKDPKLHAYALDKLDALVDRFWAELADSVARIEELYEDEAFAERTLAALVASKIYFYLGELDDALSLALGANELFDVERKNEYVDTVISKAIDKYIELRNTEEKDLDARLESIVDRMMTRCIGMGEYRQVLGIALETNRLDVIENVFNTTHDVSLLTYVLEVVMSVVAAPEARKQVLLLLVKLFQSQAQTDYFSIAQCYVYLNESVLASDLFKKLVDRAAEHHDLANTEQDALMIAYQIAFDLVESASQEFLKSVQQELQQKLDLPPQGQEIEKPQGKTAWGVHICQILSGVETIRLYLEFLQDANHADLSILRSTKEVLDAQYSAYHSAVSLSNAYMNAGTASDQFLRENLEWLAKASNWSKFTATAALGVINKGNLKQGMSILRPYLPSDGPSSSVYSEGGSLFALGLIHANHGGSVLELLINTLRTNTADVVQHGAALGLGAAGMATENEEVYEELRNVLYADSAIAGEAAGYAMGLVHLGTGSAQATEEMLQYAQETQHEKIIRGLAVGIALLNYGRESEADSTIDTLIFHKDAIMRYGGVYALALAYAGTGQNKAISRLLHLAVSDGSDDVRRAAVTGLGFLLFRNPEHVPETVQLLGESYNPHVRYGAAMALGIACAGTGLDAALDLLEPMTKDTVDFVRQGACMALAMIVIEQNVSLNPRVQTVRKTFDRIITEKHEEAMAKFGATLAQGLIDAGGRNVTISLRGRGGSTNAPAIVGMALFLQYWYWFPMANFASLAFTPTAFIGLSRNLEMPQMELVSRARPSLFAYPPPLEVHSEKKLEKVETAVLSTTVKSQARQRTKEKKKAALDGAGPMDTDEKPDEEEKKEAPAPKPEPTQEMVRNCSRVTPYQLKYVASVPHSRFLPVRPVINSRAEIWQSTDKLAVHDEDADGDAKERTRARQLDTSVTGGGGGIMMLLDREPNKSFTPLSLQGDKGESMDHQEAAATLASAPDTEDKAPTSVPEAEQAPQAEEDVDMADPTPEAR
ncbi:proteasome regulatory particle base subunit [Malassezia vespertilionis]|uniref:26S proteasome regulatory subunit RPN2 n=1 Tax=Malassezia vespertilionis TaxID=2020962 RepID=A0A2N1JHG8_9BASI|nr:proteasome regulatory particle base subunit [Malassezia vespertilionis]PKI85993.1 Rpn2p [Malassezia vespertilionis]WFD05284.1 proteasome regulatory particle base subunit [Malassezia vespertilionis]